MKASEEQLKIIRQHEKNWQNKPNSMRLDIFYECRGNGYFRIDLRDFLALDS